MSQNNEHHSDREESNDEDMHEEHNLSSEENMMDDVFTQSTFPGIPSAAIRTIHGWLRGDNRFRVSASSVDAAMEENRETQQDYSTITSSIGPIPSSMHTFLRSFGFSTATNTHTNNSQFQSLLEGLRADGDETRQLNSLQELAETLSISTEESMGGFQSEQFVIALLTLFDYELNPNIMILSCRCLYNLLEAWPPAASHIVVHNGIQKLCAKLISIEYIDLAETAIETLERLSHQHGLTIIRQNGLQAVLSFLDFFPLSIQRQSMNIIMNSCKYVPSDLFPAVQEAFPLLCNLLLHSDSKVLEKTCLSISRLIESFSRDEAKLKIVTSDSFLLHFVDIIRPPVKSHVSPLTITTILKTVTIICRCCTDVAHSLLSTTDLASILSDHLTGTSIVSKDRLSISSSSRLSTSPYSAAVHRAPDQLYEILMLIQFMLPTLPSTGFFDDRLEKSETDMNASTSAASASSLSWITLLENDPQVVHHFSKIMIPVLIDMYTSGMTMNVKQSCLISLQKCLYFATSEVLRIVLRDTNMSSFIAGLLSTSDILLAIYGLQMTAMLLSKLPDIFKVYFTREGVLHGLLRIFSAESIPDLFKDQMISVSPTPSEIATIAMQSDQSSSLPMMRKAMLRLNVDALRNLFPSLMKLSEEERTVHLSQLVKDTSQELIHLYFPDAIPDHPVIDHDGNKQRPLSDKPHDASHDVLRQLKHIAHLLEGVQVAEGIQKLAKLMQESDDPGAMSAFEILESGVMDRLLVCMTQEDTTCYSMSLMQRIHVFMTCFLEYHQLTPYPSYSDALTRLVMKLEEILHRTEQFTLSSAASNSASQTSFPLASPLETAYKSLAQPLKLHVRQGDREDALIVQGFTTFLSVRRLLGQPTTTRSSASTTAIRQSFLNLSTTRRNQQLAASRAGTAAAHESSHGASSEPIDLNVSRFEQRSRHRHLDTLEHSDNERENDEDEEVEEEEEEEEEESDEMDASDAEHASSEVETDDHDHPSHADTADIISSSIHPTDPLQHLASLDESRHLTYAFSIDASTARHESLSLDDNTTMHKAFGLKLHPSRWMPEVTVSLAITEKTRVPVDMMFTCTNEADWMMRWRRLCPLALSSVSMNVLYLLRLLHTLVSQGSRLVATNAVSSSNYSPWRPELFYSTQLNAKVMRQLQDPYAVLSGNMPDWLWTLLSDHHALFPFETRSLYLTLTKMGVGRSLLTLQELLKSSTIHVRIPRHKVRIERDALFVCGLRALQMYAGSHAVLDVSYVGEVGFGSGPTQEFFTLMSRAFQEKSWALFREETGDVSTANEATRYVWAPEGLYPKPRDPRFFESTSREKSVLAFLYVSLGRLLGKAMLDSRLLDMHLSPLFYRWLLERETQMTLEDLMLMDTRLYRSLMQLKEMSGHSFLLDLMIPFVLPGDPSIELVPNGSQQLVNNENVMVYIEKVAHMTLYGGVYAPMMWVKQGFHQVLSLSSLKVLDEQELHAWIYGGQEQWTLPLLSEAIRTDHGYHRTSPAILMLMEILCEMDAADQACFMQFVTGSPRVPVGGLKALRPMLTVVKRIGESGGVHKPNDQLPSAMTCANYLRLPDYSSKEIMAKRLRYAMREGSDAFFLS